MKKEFIEIKDENNNIIKMEVISIFKQDDNEYNYIIYCDEERKNYYVAKYTGEDIVDLNTDLSVKELAFCNDYFKKVVNK